MSALCRFVARVVRACGCLALLLVAPVAGAAEDAVSRFESANLLYEKGQFEPAAQAYEALIREGVRSAPLLFNAGNAWFKAGKRGRAVAWWLQAEAVEPRNDRIQINLEFVRKEVHGGVVSAPQWPAQLRRVNLNEWAALLLSASWLCFGSLAAMAWKPAWRGRLRAPAILGGLAVAVTVSLLVVTLRDRNQTIVAVVTTDEAVVRFGPLAASQSAFVARDGTEFLVIDRKDEWLRVSDVQGRDGWLLSNQVIQLQGGQVFAESGPPGPALPLQAHWGGRGEDRH